MEEAIAAIAEALRKASTRHEAEKFMAALLAALDYATVIDDRVDPLIERVAELEARLNDLTKPPSLPAREAA